MLSTRNQRLATAACAGAIFGAALLGAIPLANATQDPAANPLNCSSADLEGVRAGVDASTSAYLYTHPDLNTFMGTLQGLSREQVAARVGTYMDSHPQERAEMAGLRQPLVDLKNRCGASINP